MKTRIISAIVALIIVVPLLILGGNYFSFGVGILSILAFREMMNLRGNKNKMPIFVQIVSMICMLFLILSNDQGFSIMFGVSYKGLALSCLLIFTPTLFYKKDNYATKDALYLFGVTTLLGLVFNSFILVRAFGLYRFIYLLLITTMTDTFAMIFGKLIGKHKLCPTISPNKTWEGSIGGSLLATVIAAIFYHFLIADINVLIICLTLILTIIGQFGDLFFSRIKRDNDIKDFSNIMPGHGGILDRLDSLIFVVLAYLLVFSIL